MQEWVTLVKEGGSLIILGFIVMWITRSLNGKLDRLTDAVKDLTNTMKRHVTIPLPQPKELDEV